MNEAMGDRDPKRFVRRLVGAVAVSAAAFACSPSSAEDAQRVASSLASAPTSVFEHQRLLPAKDASRYFGSSVALGSDTLITGNSADDTDDTSVGTVRVFARSGNAWVAEARIVPTDVQQYLGFGQRIAMSGGTVLVSASVPLTNDEGVVYVFERDGAGFTQRQKLTQPALSQNDFGSAIAISGDTAIVTAPYDGVRGTWSGAAFVYARSGSTFATQQKLSASDGMPYAGFGRSVSISGDTAVVGALGELDPDLPVVPSAAYVFVRSGTSWSEQQKLTITDATNVLFGTSVFVSGDVAFVGAPGDDERGTDAGAAYVFVRSGTTWTQLQKLLPEPGVGARFGGAITVSGDTALVSAVGRDGVAFDGAGYVFVRSGATWVLQEKLVNDDPVPNDYFSHSVGLSGETAVLGASGDNSSLVVFERDGSSWEKSATVSPTDWATGDRFGSSISVSGDTALVGAPSEETNVVVRTGTVTVFSLQGDFWRSRQKLVALESGRIANSRQFGWSVSLSGDTALIGDPGRPAYVYVRTGAGGFSSNQRLAPSDGVSGDFGHSVALSGDTALIGAPTRDALGTGSGAVYPFARTGTTWSSAGTLLGDDTAAGDFFGGAVAISGDTAIVGAREDDGRAAQSGSAYVFTLTSAGFTQQQKLVPADGAAGDLFGQAVAITGDTALVGASHDDDRGADSGAVYVFVRTGSSWTEQRKLVPSDAADGMELGISTSLSSGGALVGGRDAAYSFVRSGTSFSERRLLPSDGIAGDGFGTSIAASGESALVGAPLTDEGGSAAGKVYVFGAPAGQAGGGGSGPGGAGGGGAGGVAGSSGGGGSAGARAGTGGASDGGASEGGAGGEAGEAQGGAAGQGAAAGEAGEAQGGAAGQGAAAGEAGEAQGGGGAAGRGGASGSANGGTGITDGGEAGSDSGGETGPANPADDDGGCGCRAASSRGGSRGLAALVLGLSLAVARRRRARGRTASA
jgi:hypothetical protein